MKLNTLFILLSASILLIACGSGGGSSTTSSSGWVWAGGSNQVNSYGNYGSLGVPATGNQPGARYIAVSWVGNDGNFWLFGGSGYASSGNSGNLNDLWEYNPTTKTWTWQGGSNQTNAYGVYGVQGVPASANIPGARLGAVSWRDLEGNFWLFGGFGNGEAGIPGALNDLWKFNPTTKLWTWVNGSKEPGQTGIYGIKGVSNSLNSPAARLGPIGWADNAGNLWMFGGSNDLTTLNDFNDLWKYDISTNQWTWMSGESTLNNFGIYNIQGVTNINSQPGSRIDAISWYESNGTMWLFGGSGFDGIGTRGLLNDLWKYDPLTNRWTWMSGNNMANSYGTYGTLGISTPNTIPGAREHRVPIAWAANSSKLLMFAADGYSSNDKGLLNDLWSYNPSNNQWTWLSGSNESNAYSTYGSLGVSGASNYPGARMDSVGWVDANGNLWIFGGQGNAESNNGYLNDLWKFTISTN